MNRTIKEATVKRFHHDSHEQLRTHLNGLTPYEYICKIWTSEPEKFILNSNGESQVAFDDRMALINMLAAMPDAGISLGGGLRKVRFSREGVGRGEGTELSMFLVEGRCLCFS